MKNKHSKILKILNSLTPPSLMEGLSHMEYILLNDPETQGLGLVPQEANFQLPNIFLKSKINSKVEKLLKETKKSLGWDSSLDAAIDFLGEVEVVDALEEDLNPEFSEEVLEELLKARHGNQ